MKTKENFKKGAVEMVVLQLLKDSDMYGYQLVHELNEKSGGLFIIKEGTLYPSLYRIIEKNYISCKSELVGKKRTRIYYHVEKEGLEALENMKTDYSSIAAGIANILNGTISDAKAE